MRGRRDDASVGLEWSRVCVEGEMMLEWSSVCVCSEGGMMVALNWNGVVCACAGKEG